MSFVAKLFKASPLGMMIDAISGGDEPAAAAFPARPSALKKLDVAGLEAKKKLRRGRVGKPTIKTGPLGLGDSETKSATILGG